MISSRLMREIKLNPKRAYQIAHDAKVHPSTLSKILCGIEKVKPNDQRVIAIGKVLGLTPDECFEHTKVKV